MSEYGHRLEFNVNGIAICEESGEKYELRDNKVQKIKNINNILRFLFKKFVIIFINSIKNHLTSW